MSEIVEVSLSDLLVDTGNPRLKDEQPSQQAAVLALVAQEKKGLLKLATDIVKFGSDPTTLPAVISTADQKKRYLVVEGNRRVIALKALETPSLVASALNGAEQKQLAKLAKQFASKPISSIQCVLFESQEDASHWIELRHTGQNGGVGLVEWGADEKDRYNARHGTRSPAGQIIDYVENLGTLSEEAQNSRKGIITNVDRLLPKLKDHLGLQIVDGQVYSSFPASEINDVLTQMVEDFKTGRVKVGDIYDSQKRDIYAESVFTGKAPDSNVRLTAPQVLGRLDNPESEGDSEQSSPITAQKPKLPKKTKHPTERTALIPGSCILDIQHPRINSIYIELLSLSVDQFPNACSVALRVFLELSVDHYIAANGVMTKAQIDSRPPLASRLKKVAKHLEDEDKIDQKLRASIESVADSPRGLAASTVNFNQYVHNKWVYPKASELRIAWDELQPFIEKLWS